MNEKVSLLLRLIVVYRPELKTVPTVDIRCVGLFFQSDISILAITNESNQ